MNIIVIEPILVSLADKMVAQQSESLPGPIFVDTTAIVGVLHT